VAGKKRAQPRPSTPILAALGASLVSFFDMAADRFGLPILVKSARHRRLYCLLDIRVDIAPANFNQLTEH
jgi:hypothetical protein